MFDAAQVPFDALLKVFWESHDPTQGMRQGNDVGTTYRSAIYVLDDAQRREAEASRDAYQAALSKAGRGQITTEIAPAGPLLKRTSKPFAKKSKTYLRNLTVRLSWIC